MLFIFTDLKTLKLKHLFEPLKVAWVLGIVALIPSA